MKFDKNDYSQEVNTGLTLTAFLGTVALFFSGLLISQIDSFNNSIRLPIVYLIICTLSFIFAGIIYSNASGHITQENVKAVVRHNSFANVLSEFLGLNIFLASIPMVINAVTNDNLIRVAVGVSVLGSLFIYSISSFSILSRIYKKAACVSASLIFILCLVALLCIQLWAPQSFPPSGIVFLVVYTLWVTTLFPRDINRLAP